MRRPRILSGNEVVKIFIDLGFETVSQRGSHVKLRRIVGDKKQTLTLVSHKELDKGTLHAIYRQVLRYVSEEELASHFYSA